VSLVSFFVADDAAMATVPVKKFVFVDNNGDDDGASLLGCASPPPPLVKFANDKAENWFSICSHSIICTSGNVNDVKLING
jgi:hypothetical protein